MSEKTKFEEQEESISWFVAITTYMGYAILIVFGHMRDFFGKVTGNSRYFGNNVKPKEGYAPLLKDWENFYTRRLYHRIQDCWNKPIAGPPRANAMNVVLRTSHDGNRTMVVDETKEPVECVNLGSYNYLGFADDWEESCADDVKGALSQFPAAMSASRADAGNLAIHKDLERLVADFLGKEDAVVFNMGFGTNATGIPALAGKGTLIVSDALNHSSIVAGARASGATVRVFKHNDPGSLEGVLRNAIVEGQPRTHRPWRKIVVMIEGIYSMEGEIVDLPGIVAVAKQYRAYIYLDEAHSIGCLGKTGRGVCEHTGVPTSDIDIMMGTFTKSFGAMGGYIAGSKALVDHIRTHSAGTLYSNALSPVVTAQVLRAFRVILDEDGSGVGPAKLAAAKSNSNYFRQKLMDMGLEVYGDWDSPVIPVMLYNPAKIAAFGRECLKVGLAVVVVGFPATPLISSRARFCISAGHTKETMDSALERIEKVCEVMKLKYNKRVTG